MLSEEELQKRRVFTSPAGLTADLLPSSLRAHRHQKAPPRPRAPMTHPDLDPSLAPLSGDNVPLSCWMHRVTHDRLRPAFPIVSPISHLIFLSLFELSPPPRNKVQGMTQCVMHDPPSLHLTSLCSVRTGIPLRLILLYTFLRTSSIHGKTHWTELYDNMSMASTQCTQLLLCYDTVRCFHGPSLFLPTLQTPQSLVFAFVSPIPRPVLACS